MHNCIGSCHLTEVLTLAIKPFTLHDYFLVIGIYVTTHFPGIRQDLTEIFELVQNVTITEGLKLHNIVTASASWGQLGHKLTFVRCEACISLC